MNLIRLGLTRSFFNRCQQTTYFSSSSIVYSKIDLSKFTGREQELEQLLKQVNVQDIGKYADQLKNLLGNSNVDLSALLKKFSKDAGGANPKIDSDLLGVAQRMLGKMMSSRSTSASNSVNQQDNEQNLKGTLSNVQQIYSMFKSLDKNGKGHIDIQDVECILKDLGLSSISPQLSKLLTNMTDKNKNGKLSFSDLMTLISIIRKLSNVVRSNPK